MIRLDRVSKIYSKTDTGLGQVNVDFESGEWVTLLGPSGCGKTTLLRLVAGLEVPTTGTLINPFSKTEVSFVFQEPALLPWLSVTQNIALPLTLRGMGRAEAEARAMPWLKKLKIERHLKSRPDELSGGIKMRVSLARALITEPKLLLLDEPFAALDEPIRIELGLELRDLFRSLRPTILMVTHSITEGLWLSDRVIVFQGQPGTLRLDHQMGLSPERSLAQRGDPEFLSMVEKCFKLLRGESK
jgi:NitT/TauT family transport system ATP-binding protein